MDDIPWNEWYSNRMVQFNINRFSRFRALNFRYKPVGKSGKVLLDENGREVERITRDVPVYRADDIQFYMFDFFANKKPHFYCTTSRYDWRQVSWPPNRLVGLDDWRKGTFKPAEESGNFEIAKDVVFDVDCRGHAHMDEKDDIKRWNDAMHCFDKVLDFCQHELKLQTAWLQFTGGGLQLGLCFEELFKCPMIGYDDNIPNGKRFKYHGVWAAGVVKKICKALAFLDRYETDKQEGYSFGNVNIDLAPNYRRGVFRQPYSVHPKYGNVVWPLSKDEWVNFDSSDLSIFSPVERLKERLLNRDMPNLMEDLE